MRTEKENPAYHDFKYLLPPSGRYPARWVDIFSNTDDTMRYADVEVVFIPRGANVLLDNKFWSRFALYNKKWEGDLGNSVSGWMESDGLNPEKVFGGMLAYGFTNQKSLNNAIKEFAHIEECEWARSMSNGLMSEVLVSKNWNKKAIYVALERKFRHDSSQWAGDMLDAFETT